MDDSPASKLKSKSEAKNLAGGVKQRRSQDGEGPTADNSVLFKGTEKAGLGKRRDLSLEPLALILNLLALLSIAIAAAAAAAAERGDGALVSHLVALATSEDEASVDATDDADAQVSPGDDAVGGLK